MGSVIWKEGEVFLVLYMSRPSVRPVGTERCFGGCYVGGA